MTAIHTTSSSVERPTPATAASRPQTNEQEDPYRALSRAQDIERTNSHYMLPVRFFEILTGGAWNIYSCNLWTSDSIDHDDFEQQTRSQERKMDAFAELLELSPGKRVIDIGCGWGGSLNYLGHKYGIQGIGVCLSPLQQQHATAWSKRLGNDCRFELCHWEDFSPDRPVDAIMTDEVIVHFSKLEEFFHRAYGWLNDDGILVNKELHFGHAAFGFEPSAGIRFIDEIFGVAGFYRSLADELSMTNRAGFSIEEVRQIEGDHYVATATSWRRNLRRHETELIALVGKETYRRYLVYLTLVVSMFSGDGPTGKHRRMKPHFVKARKLPPELCREWGLEARRDAHSLRDEGND